MTTRAVPKDSIVGSPLQSDGWPAAAGLIFVALLLVGFATSPSGADSSTPASPGSCCWRSPCSPAS